MCPAPRPSAKVPWSLLQGTIIHGLLRPDITSNEKVLTSKKASDARLCSPFESLGALVFFAGKVASMPPGEIKLSKPEIELLRQWVEKGAPVEAGGLPMARKDEPQHFTENGVLPIFQMRCVLCHGKRRQEGGLDSIRLELSARSWLDHVA